MPYLRDTWDQPRESAKGSWIGSLTLHAALAAAIVSSAFYLNWFHGARWGKVSSGSAISATLVSSTPSLPLPNPHISTNDVLATETPSPAPLPPLPEAKVPPVKEAVPVVAKPKHTKKVASQHHPKPPEHFKPPKTKKPAVYGQAAPSSIPMSNPSAQKKSVVVQNGNFGAQFGWYVAIIQRTVSQNWYSQLADPSASMGRSVVVTFTVHRDGSVSNARIARSSGVPSFDLSAIQAVQRVGAFGPLPREYSGSSVSVAYTFTYDQATARH